MKRVLVAGLAVMAFTSIAQADIWCGTTQHQDESQLWIESMSQHKSGTKLHSDCTSSNSKDLSNCDGYITGVADVLGSQNANTICVPNDIAVGKLTAVVRKYLVDHPAGQRYSGVSQVYVALAEAFPCKAPTTPAK